jgi:hypothetical protein
MAIRFTAIRMSGGTSHQHIIHLWWVNPADGSTGDNSRDYLVDWIENQHGKAYVEDRYGHRADVGVVHPKVEPKYLRTHRDGVWTDDLLALPKR